MTNQEEKKIISDLENQETAPVKEEKNNSGNNGSGASTKDLKMTKAAKTEVSKYGFDFSEIKGDYVGTYHSESLRMVKMHKGLLNVAVISVSLVLLVFLCLVFVPWQQSISGRGKVIIFSPMERPQHLEVAIPGRISKWYVRDGQEVTTGDPIVALKEVDPKFLNPKQLDQLRKRKIALKAKRDAANSKAEALADQIDSLRYSRTSVLASTNKKSEQASDRLEVAKQAVQAAKQNLKTAKLNLERRKSLFDKGLRSKRDFELAELDFVKAKTDLERTLAQLEVAETETEVADLMIAQKDADTIAKVHSTKASYSAAKETVASTDAEIHRLAIEIGHLESRIHQRILKSPCCGRIVRLMKTGAGETVKAGSRLAVIATDTNDLAAELIVQGNDAPLITPGRHVRLQFAGWPAVQFTGWPSVAVGTFAGTVAVVDAVDDGTGKFRIIVRPDKDAVENGKDQPWPSSRFLRPGSEVHGWVMLNNVSLGFELWRQFNAFPPTIDQSEFKKQGGDVKRKLK